MRTGHLLLVVISLLVVSSDKTVKVSARCPDPDSVTLNPGKPCDFQTCKTNCASKYHDGVGICLNPNRCYSEYCLDLPSTTVDPRGLSPPLIANQDEIVYVARLNMSRSFSSKIMTVFLGNKIMTVV
ncbi:hypothetical protein PVAP13_1NG482800 [Panicum virgatum]|uniref:Uncharacterized protein n=1 Tax=Panicum virgatum TaxID=38727 RepID=A0A8T0XAK7_PANVG|nr:hypothetical protein PVAP13_1NG482800 [Panicum virgatum]